MIKKTVTYKGFNDVEQSEDLYFHLSMDDIIELETSGEEGLEAKFKRLTETKDTKEMVAAFKEIIFMSYGTRSEDGRRFDKDREKTADFMKSLAFDAFFSSLIYGGEKAVIEFILGAIPGDLAVQIDAAGGLENIQNLALPVPEKEEEELPWAHREPTNEELRKMTRKQLLDVMKRKSQEGTAG
jgi:hypothetical protein